MSAVKAAPALLAILTLMADAATNVDRAHGQQDVRDTPSRALVGTALLGGVVTDGRTPVRRALVTLAGTGVIGSRQTATDDGGRFVFPDLAEGRYTLTAEKPAYLKTFHGSRRLGQGPAAPIALADGERLADLSLTLTRGAVIAGRVLDEQGLPLASAQVSPEQWSLVDGERRLGRPAVGAQHATTDDQGRYRLYGLPPGEYVVTAGAGAGLMGEVRLTTAAEIEAAMREMRGGQVSSASTSGGAAANAPPQMSRRRVYFPDATDPASARVIVVAAGEERTGIDLVSRLHRTGRVQGVAVGPTGRPIQRMSVGVASVSAGTLWSSPGGVVLRGPEGRFTMTLPPGRYLFFGRGDDVGTGQNAPMTLWTETEVAVAEEDIDNVVLQFLPGVSVSGRLQFQGASAPPDVSTVRLSLTAIPRIAGSAAGVAPVSPQADGSFTLTGVAPGRYRVSVTPLRPWALRSAVVDGRDTLDRPLDVPSGRDVSDLVVTMTDRPTELTGTLFDQLGRPAPEFLVVAFSVDRSHWGTAPRRMSGVVKPGSDGRFSVSGLPPGEYLVAALTDVEPEQLRDISFLELLAASGIRLTLGEGERRVQDLKIRPGGI